MGAFEVRASYERWLWIELLGFDNALEDFGVGRLCENAGFVPESITLLLADPEFVHRHDGMGETRILPPTVCSYGAHPFNEERERQEWTNVQLKALLQVLQAKGIKVFFTNFDAPVETGWIAQHPELFYIDREGHDYAALCVWKRFSDGRFYRDWFTERVLSVIDDYGFDGYHGGDGFAHPRLPIYFGDFSDDIVEQYAAWSALPWPETHGLNAKGEPGRIKERSAWIWKERRQDWIEFHRQMSTRFWAKLVAELHGRGKLLFMNGSWTRDPFEALYRYGVDYVALSAAGVDGFFPETAGAANEYGGDLPYREAGCDDWDPSHVVNRFSLNLMMFKAAVPDSKLIFMHGVKDTNEAWNGIRHAPTNVESEILSHTGVFHVRSDGTLESASSGLLVTLSDGLAPFEWNWLTRRWDLGYALRPTAILGAAIYWSQEHMAAALKDYCENRRAPYTQLLWALSERRAPILATVRSENVSAWQGPVVVFYPDLLPREEWSRILGQANGPVLTLGGLPPDVSEDAIVLTESTDPHAMSLTVHGWRGAALLAPDSFTSEDRPCDDEGDPLSWLYDLPRKPVTSEILSHAAEWITTLSHGIRIRSESADVRAWGYFTASDTIRVHVRNDGFYYRAADVDVGRELAKVKTLTAFPGNPVSPQGTRFRFKMAGKSMAVFEVALNTDG